MSDIILFHSPGACSRVTMNALEEIGVSYEDRPVNIFVGEQKSPGYLAINPKGKVPALKFNGRVYTENAAILHFLGEHFPEARLFPQNGAGVGSNEPLEDLVWCAATIHPMVRQIRMPIRFTDADPEGVKSHGMKSLPAVTSQVAKRLANQPWWYGDSWSIVDVYLYWNFSTAAGGGFDLSQWPRLEDHARTVRARPSFERVLQREKDALVTGHITLPPGATL